MVRVDQIPITGFFYGTHYIQNTSERKRLILRDFKRILIKIDPKLVFEKFTERKNLEKKFIRNFGK
jgi:hypothetical protein